jgi:transcriptional regulator with XRE-family HTH domain
MKLDDLNHTQDAIDILDIRDLRKARRESQSKFWKRFGVTHSTGSRFEQGLGIPVSVAILVKLYLEGKVSEGDLQRARRAARAATPLDKADTQSAWVNQA